MVLRVKILTLSDLQKLAVRPVLFLLVTHVELLMARWIRGRGLPEEEVMSRLPEERRTKVKQEWNRLRKNNLAVDRLTATYFRDKRHLLLALEFISGKKQRADAEKDLEDRKGITTGFSAPQSCGSVFGCDLRSLVDSPNTTSSSSMTRPRREAGCS